MQVLPPLVSNDDIRRFERNTPIESLGLPDSTLELIQNSAETHPDATALRFLMQGSADEDGVSYSYPEFLQRVLQTANGLNALGVDQTNVVSFMLPNLPQTHFTLWGGEAAGVVNPVNQLLEADHIAHVLCAANTRVLVALAPFPGTDTWEKVEQIKPMVPSLETVLYVDLCRYLPAERAAEIRRQLPLPQHDWARDFDTWMDQQPGDRLLSGRVIARGDIASLFHTGGTTGVPKLAPHTHYNEVANARMLQCLLRFDADDVVLGGLPLFHVNAAVVTGVLPLLTGSEILLASAQGYRSPVLIEQFWRVVERHRVSFFSAVPAIYAALLQVPFGDSDTSSLKAALCGGAPLPTEVHRNFEALTGAPLLEGYGLTESTCGATANLPLAERLTGSIGFSLPYAESRVVKLDGNGAYLRDCEPDEAGTLVLRGPHIFSGYSDPAKNGDIWVDGDWFNTGDLARQDADGRFWLTGRSKDLIIRGGHNIDPGMIEEALNRHPAVAMAAAVGKPCPRVGELPVAYVSLRRDSKVSEAELIDFCMGEISERAAIPKNIWVLDELPLTGVGKIFKPSLRHDAIRRVFEHELGQQLAPAQFRVSVEACDRHGTRACVKIADGDDAVSAEIERRLGRYAVHCEILNGPQSDA
ncbi:acyl-CoA synthetase [Marinobacterium nitratireducens]|uniref:Acyl-CoA synthetase n=1 Tax=Marinobacterium nitratireducens TaxID=518897 RepID=A0A917ZHI8_9GAMM|nr:acyl-CoA synthetase [Marinobacterium nitratireducens]GGO82134.1 acyl-CoA synthetase [Marinobacterium nitratireducens]